MRQTLPAKVDAAEAPASANAVASLEDLTSRLDGLLHAAQAKAARGLSPVSQGLAFLDWATHMANAPSGRLAQAASAARQWARLAGAAYGGPAIEPDAADHRFGDPAWRHPPFHLLAQGFLLAEEWWAQVARASPGVSLENQRIVSFMTRQLVDIVSPSNVPWLNPEVLKATVESGGENFVHGFENMLTDLQEMASGYPCGPDAVRVGKDVAATPGKVIFRNDLIELIQYAPSTAEVGREPVLIVPAWIMKYYILDLSPHNSLIRYLVEQGRTVFAISWRNPGAEMRDTSLDDYRAKGVMAALDVVSEVCGGARIHACGYCLGGTLLSIAAAAMAREADERLASITLFCAQTDFTEAGELQLFITEDQLAFLDDVMQVQGYLDSRQMAGAFQLLRSNDLVWSRAIKSYLIGEREHPNDLMAWNADGTRMPARMHSEYLSRLFLNNDLAEGRIPVDGKPVALGDIRAPCFVVGTQTDHIAPWRSVYKFHLLTETDFTFVLTNGGHNAGVVSEPGHPGRHLLIAHSARDAFYVGPDDWTAQAEFRVGSWWPAWSAWLETHSTGRVAPPPMGPKHGAVLGDAPGKYVLEH